MPHRGVRLGRAIGDPAHDAPAPRPSARAARRAPAESRARRRSDERCGRAGPGRPLRAPADRLAPERSPGRSVRHLAQTSSHASRPQTRARVPLPRSSHHGERLLEHPCHGHVVGLADAHRPSATRVAVDQRSPVPRSLAVPTLRAASAASSSAARPASIARRESATPLAADSRSMRCADRCRRRRAGRVSLAVVVGGALVGVEALRLIAGEGRPLDRPLVPPAGAASA